MIRMFVGEQDAMNHSDLLSQQLAAQIRGRVNQQVTSGKPEDGTGAGSLVMTIRTLADVASEADHGHADRGSGSKQDHLSAQFL